MPIEAKPKHHSYDVVIIGGAIMGSALAWFLVKQHAFDGRILVVERDPSYENSSTAHTTSCMRQQFSNALNVKISQFAAEFVKNIQTYMGNDPRVPKLPIRSYGYMYLASDNAFAEVLRANQLIQVAEGAETRLLNACQIKAAYPFYNVDDIILGSINTLDEGYWDASTMFDWLRRQAAESGVEYISNEVVDVQTASDHVTGVVLKSGEGIACGFAVNAAGPRAAVVAQMAGIHIPVEPRKRYSWIFRAEKPLSQDLPLTIDPSGVHVRENGGGTYQAGGHSKNDPAVDFDDFAMESTLWEEHIWPTLAHRIPQFEAIKVTHEWAGHYAYNTLDQNAVLGPHPRISNFIFMNGFSGHGLQQAPAVGRGMAEFIAFGEYRSLDLSALHYDRILNKSPLIEDAII